MTTNLLLAELLDTDGNIKLNGTQTIKKRTTTSLSCWQQQDGTGRLHWYWNTEGGTLPTFYRGNEHALDLTMHGDPALPPYLKFRTADGVGKSTGNNITWTDTLLVDPVNFVYTFNSNSQFPQFIINDTNIKYKGNLFIINDSNITYKGYNIFHEGNVASLPFLPLTGGTLSGQLTINAALNVVGPGNNSFITVDIHSSGQNEAAIHLGTNIGTIANSINFPHIAFHTSGNGTNIIDSQISAFGGNGTQGQGNLKLLGFIINDGRAPTLSDELTPKWWVEDQISNINLDNKVNVAGDTMTGPLIIQDSLTSQGANFTNFVTLHANPSNPMHAATKQYVDDKTASINPMISWNDQIDVLEDTSSKPINTWFNVKDLTINVPTFNSTARVALILYNSNIHIHPVTNGTTYGGSLEWRLLWNGIQIASTQTNCTSNDNIVLPIIFMVPVNVNSGSSNTLTLQVKKYGNTGYGITNHGQTASDPAQIGQSEINIIYF